MTSDNYASAIQALLEADEAGLAARWEAVAEELSELDADETRIAVRRQELDAERQMLLAVANLRRLKRAEVAPGSPALQRAGDPIPALIYTTPQKPKQVVVDLLDAKPSHAWDADAMHDALTRRGLDINHENVRAILQRAARAGEVRRIAHGVYQSARVADHRSMAPHGAQESPAPGAASAVGAGHSPDGVPGRSIREDIQDNAN